MAKGWGNEPWGQFAWGGLLGGAAPRRYRPQQRQFQPRLVWDQARTVLIVRIRARGEVTKLRRSRKPAVLTRAHGTVLRPVYSGSGAVLRPGQGGADLAVRSHASPSKAGAGSVSERELLSTSAQGRVRMGERELRELLVLLSLFDREG